MSISNAVSQDVKSAVLAGLQTGDTATAGLLGAVTDQMHEVSRLLATITPTLGQHLDLNA